MADLSRLVDPRAVEFFERFMSRQAEAAMTVTGAPDTTWSGRYSSRTQQVKIDLGVAVAEVTWDGDIEYDAKTVIQPIWLVCRKGGRGIDNYRLISARHAFRFALHENLHTVSERGRTHNQQKEAFQDPANRALEEGLTELCARRFLNAYLRELGVAELAPEILTVDYNPEGTYPQFVPAVEILVERLAERTGLGEEEILRRLIVPDCETRWQVVGDLLFDAEGLADLVPEADHAMVKGRLIADLRQPFSRLAQLDGSIEAMINASTAAGYEALGWFDQDVEALRLDHDPARRPEQLLTSILQRQGRAALAVTGTHHLTTTDRSVTDLTLGDGTTVGEALQDLCEHWGEENQPPEDLIRYKEAVHVLLEHNILQSAGRGREVGMEPELLAEPGVLVFSEGLARALADDRLNAYIDQLGLDEIAPGIRRAPSLRPPDRAAVAARTFVQEIGGAIRQPAKDDEKKLVEMDRDVLLRQLAGQDPASPWPALTRVLFETQGFRDYLEWGEFDDVKAMIQQPMTAGFARIAEPVPAGVGSLASAEAIGREAAQAARGVMAELDQALRPPAPTTPVAMHAMAAVDRVPRDAQLAVDLLTTGRAEQSTTHLRPSTTGEQPRGHGPRPGLQPGRGV